MNHRLSVVAVVLVSVLAGCSESDKSPNSGARGGSESVGGNPGEGGSVASGGATASRPRTGTTGGRSAAATEGSSTVATSSTGGERAAGGSSHSSKVSSNSSSQVASGGSSTAKQSATGGKDSTGGSSKAGGTASVGGTSATGGTTATGGNSTSGGASTDTGSGYVPCAASPCKVLPLGDSITHGLQSSDGGGYRSQLFKLAVAADKTLTFLGSQSAGPAKVSDVTFPKNHEGYDGYTVESGFSTYGTPGISSKIPSPAFDTVPDIVLLHIGTNDITSTGSASTTTSTRLDGLLGKIVAAAPKALIVVAQIIPVNWTSADLNTYNSKIPDLVQARASKGEHVVAVDMSKMPKSGLATDGVHPNDQGYAYMADVWYAAIKDYLR